MSTVFPLVSLNIGLPATVVYDGNRDMRSGILKKPVRGKVFLDRLGFAGDGVSDSANHGGDDKAICGYCFDHYGYWERELDRKLAFAAFGENLTISGLVETVIRIGDIYRLGEAEIQCTQPRQPCLKLNRIFGLKDMARKVQTTGFSGYYFRVLTPGWVAYDSALSLLQPGPGQFSVEAANNLMHGDDQRDLNKLREIVSFPPLSQSWREVFAQRLGD